MNLKLETSKDKVGLLLVLVFLPSFGKLLDFLTDLLLHLFKHNLNIESYWKSEVKFIILKCYLEYDFETY